jgi:hypothetical protein
MVALHSLTFVVRINSGELELCEIRQSSSSSAGRLSSPANEYMCRVDEAWREMGLERRAGECNAIASVISMFLTIQEVAIMRIEKENVLSRLPRQVEGQ